MRIIYIADGRSPIARNWIRHFADSPGHEVHLLSTFPCRPDFELASLNLLPVAFSGLAAGSGAGASLGRRPGVRPRTALRHWLGPLTVPAAARRAREIITALSPDLIHALRIPFEGMVAAEADPEAPLILSVWGNDFTLHAPASPGMRSLTRSALARADGLHTDCERDLRLARRWGYSEAKPGVVLPTSGGVRTEVFHPEEGALPEGSALAPILRSLPAGVPVVVNPRGLRAYVRNDVFFAAVPLIQGAFPQAQFLCPGMAGERQAHAWLERNRIRGGVHLLPRLSPPEMAAVFRRAEVSVSPSEHDGTPNSLLEAMACGCFPVAGDLESIREWIEDGKNGYLVDPGDAAALAGAVRRALEGEALRTTAAARNRRLIAERARFEDGMARAEAFYEQLASRAAR